MRVQVRSASVAVIAGAIFAAAFAGTSVDAQKVTAADIAAKFTGTWKLNRELSPGVGGGASNGAPARLYEVGFFTAFQGRGGGRGGGSSQGSGGSEGPSAEERAGQAAIKRLQQFGSTITIKATADSVTFVDPQGERTYAVTDKNTAIDVGEGAVLNARSKWDKNTLKQQFIYGETKITQNWELNDAGNRINFKMQILNMSRQDPPYEAKVVYDKQP
jgi:hypothetical protein